MTTDHRELMLPDTEMMLDYIFYLFMGAHSHRPLFSDDYCVVGEVPMVHLHVLQDFC
jgi:hypothetical protein